MGETNAVDEKRKPTDALGRMLRRDLPEAMRADIEALLRRDNAGADELKRACSVFGKRLALTSPRTDIRWNPTVDAEKCVGCGVCFRFCSHGVYAMGENTAVVANPTGCVILCHNCASRCPKGAITFPPQTEYWELVCRD